MQRLFIAILLGGLAIGGASAQTSTDTAPPPDAPAAAEPAPPAESPAAPVMKNKVQEEVKQVREQCIGEAKAKGLKGPDRKAAVRECIVKTRPDLAKLIDCRKEGRAKGLSDGDLRMFVRKCKNTVQ